MTGKSTSAVWTKKTVGKAARAGPPDQKGPTLKTFLKPAFEDGGVEKHRLKLEKKLAKPLRGLGAEGCLAKPRRQVENPHGRQKKVGGKSGDIWDNILWAAQKGKRKNKETGLSEKKLTWMKSRGHHEERGAEHLEQKKKKKRFLAMFSGGSSVTLKDLTKTKIIFTKRPPTKSRGENTTPSKNTQEGKPSKDPRPTGEEGKEEKSGKGKEI